MKKFVVVIVMIAVVSTAGFSQDFDTEGLADVFGGFAEGVARALPMASTVGLQWSDAYIGKLPHLGVGASVGFASIPLTAVNPVLQEIGMGDLLEIIPEEAAPFFEAGLVGFPLPALVLDARLGGIILPFDIGVKYGWIPEDLNAEIETELEGMEVDYQLFGVDLRYALLEEPKGFTLIPDLSVGIGYNYYWGHFALPMEEGFANYTIDVPSKTGTQTYTIGMENPKVGFEWESHVIDVKAQLSKTILWLFQPYIGVGASYGRSKAGGGLFVDGISGDIDALIEAANNELGNLEDFGFALPADQDGIIVNSELNSWGFRAFGGLGINLFFLKVDASIMYDIIGQSLGAQVGLRLQF
jgi:hypothetical protein